MERTAQFKHRREPSLLGDALVKMMEQKRTGIAQRYEAANRVAETWGQILPVELAEHCRVVDLSAGCLTVEADSPSYLYELRISSPQLIEHLRLSCPSSKVRAIKVVLSR
jgi:predicted nucleic acid-binding Zn ribbon protein